MNSEFHSLALLAARARKTAMEIANRATTGHLGGSYSCTEILTALYFRTLRIDPENPKDPDRDRFVLSKGHATPVIYPILSMRGFFPAEELQGYRSIDSRLSGPITVDVPGVDMSTGSLSIGASTAVGMAMAGKYDQKAYRVYTLVGDGECEEGQIWEAFMAASKYALDNLCAIIDVNGLQIDGPTSVVMPSEPLDEKLEAFGFYVIRIDGHDYGQIFRALDEAAATKGRPTAILAKTVKGKGVSFMENVVEYHAKVPTGKLFEQAMQELDKTLKELEEE